MFTFNRLKLAVLVFPLVVLAACADKEPQVNNYVSSSCQNDPRLKITKNVVSLATMYYLFNTPMTQSNFAEVKLQNKYASGRTQIISDAFKPFVSDRLMYGGLGSSYNIQIFSLLEIPESVEQEKILKFSEPCQINNALLDDEMLRSEPRGAFYLMAGRTNFLTMRESGYEPKPNIPVKFKLFNPESSEIEEATFLMYEITGGDIQVNAPSPWEGILSKLKGETGERKWSLEKHTKNIDGRDYSYFTITRRSATASPIVGEIQGVEFETGKVD